MKPDADAAAPAAVLVTSAAKPLLDPEPIAMPRSHAAETQTQPTGPCRHPQDRLAPHLLTLRGMLLEQRSFRLEQLVELRAAECRTVDTDAADTAAGRARREVAALVADGARRAMADIELALASMVAGHYGCCHACHADIPSPCWRSFPRRGCACPVSAANPTSGSTVVPVGPPCYRAEFTPPCSLPSSSSRSTPDLADPPGAL